jgi:uncharacterized membrane protein (TIGR02234 family)
VNRGFRLIAVLLGLAGIALVVVAGFRTWATVTVNDLPGVSDMPLSGRRAAPSVMPIALAAGAGVIVMVTSVRVIRLLVALALVAGGAGIAFTSLHARQDAAATLSRALETGIGMFNQNSSVKLPPGMLDGATADPTIWPWASLAGGVLVAVSGLLGVVTGAGWPGPASRFESGASAPVSQPGRAAPPAGRTAPAGPAAVDDAQAWDALSRGDDPT